MALFAADAGRLRTCANSDVAASAFAQAFKFTILHLQFFWLGMVPYFHEKMRIFGVQRYYIYFCMIEIFVTT